MQMFPLAFVSMCCSSAGATVKEKACDWQLIPVFIKTAGRLTSPGSRNHGNPKQKGPSVISRIKGRLARWLWRMSAAPLPRVSGKNDLQVRWIQTPFTGDSDFPEVLITEKMKAQGRTSVPLLSDGSVGSRCYRARPGRPQAERPCLSPTQRTAAGHAISHAGRMGQARVGGSGRRLAANLRRKGPFN